LEKLENQIPVKNWRSSEQQLLQQLGTPPAIAFLMTLILNPFEIITSGKISDNGTGESVAGAF
jgi:hypothetical protein